MAFKHRSGRGLIYILSKEWAWSHLHFENHCCGCNAKRVVVRGHSIVSRQEGMVCRTSAVAAQVEKS